MWPFRRSTRQQGRQFSSYDDCPAIHYRFNGKGDYGPQNLDRFVKFYASRAGEAIEGRFTDEESWRPLSYFVDLWERIPPSAYTTEGLEREGVNIEETMTEARGRAILRERTRAKPPSTSQIKQLRQLGADENIADRGQAEDLIRAHQRAVQKEEEEQARLQQRLKNAPEIEACNKRLQDLGQQVTSLIPDWTPKTFDDLEPLLAYTQFVEEALGYATEFDLETLQGEPFSDGVTEEGYYLEFTRDPTESELQRFQAKIFLKYLETESNMFDHLAVLKRALPMIRASIL